MTFDFQVNVRLEFEAQGTEFIQRHGIVPARAVPGPIVLAIPDALQSVMQSQSHLQIHLLKSKIHRATVTGGSLHYEGSLTIAADLMEAAGLLPYERILCSNLANGNRFETYAIPGETGSGAIILNGATAHLGKPGDLLTIMSYAVVGEKEAKRWKPRIIVLGENNRIIARRGDDLG